MQAELLEPKTQPVAALFLEWNVITTGMVVPLDDRIIRDISFYRIIPSNKLQAEILEFDRMRDDDPRRNLRWILGDIDRFFQPQNTPYLINISTRRRAYA